MISDQSEGGSGASIKDAVPLASTYPREEHCISRKDIDPDALKIMYRLLRNGFQAFLVGGGVRDLLLGIKPKDFDIGTDARPNQIRALFRNSRIIGRRFRLVHIYFRGNKIIEVATFRSPSPAESSEEDDQNGRQDNSYGTSATDAFRRDLTINALFYDLSTFSIIDYVGGMEDLRNGLVRIIGEPAARFKEDPVRLIRTVRHAARTGFKIEDYTLKGLIQERALIKESSEVRIYEELKKDLCSGCCLDIINLLAECTLLEFLLPELAGKESPLHSEESELSQSLSTVDRLINEGQEISPTAVLATIVLFRGEKNLKRIDLPARFSSTEQIRLHLDDSFQKLAVPRKERERIRDLLEMWWRVLQTPATSLRSSAFVSRPLVSDLRGLFQIISCTLEDEDIVKILVRAEKQRREMIKQKVRRGGSRRRGKRRKMML